MYSCFNIPHAGVRPDAGPLLLRTRRASRRHKGVLGPQMWCNAPLNGYAPILFEGLPSYFTPAVLRSPPPNAAGRHGGLLALGSSAFHFYKALEASAGHLQLEMALPACICQVCRSVWLRLVDWEVKMSIFPFFFSAAGNDYSPIKGLFWPGGSRLRCPRGVVSGWIPRRLSGALKRGRALKSEARMSCVWGKSPVRAALLWKLCDLMEVKSDREGSLLSPVNEKLLVSSGLCVRGQTAGVMWERGQRQTGCLSGGGRHSLPG